MLSTTPRKSQAAMYLKCELRALNKLRTASGPELHRLLKMSHEEQFAEALEELTPNEDAFIDALENAPMCIECKGYTSEEGSVCSECIDAEAQNLFSDQDAYNFELGRQI